jgi:hypothetical protein
VGFFIFASSSKAIALLQLAFFQQSQHLRFLTSSADHPGRVGREMNRPGQRRMWGVIGRDDISSSGKGSDVICSPSLGVAAECWTTECRPAERRHSWMTTYSRHQAAASPFSLRRQRICCWIERLLSPFSHVSTEDEEVKALSWQGGEAITA